jgi:hypothetical protein
MPNHRSVQHRLSMTTTFTLLRTLNSLTPLRSVPRINLHLRLSQTIINLLIIKRTHLHNIDTIHSLRLHKQNSRTIGTVVVRDVLATRPLSLESLQRAGEDLVLVGGYHEVVGVCGAWGW